ncbi:MAG: tRNA (adenine(58)-N(1))-methyltransferase non-catalytic subunit trm6 [Sclerophora amabilis]|nr:MAG: tRNA (adenine(58)-N(1))-methyltransferase non-catalytic subunit trm6 [Sclerophora amabilis]
MHTLIQPNTHIVLRLPSDNLKLLQIVPNTIISIGKYGSFPSNALLGRPYNITYEIIHKAEDQCSTTLRIVPASEIHAHDLAANDDSRGEVEKTVDPGDEVEYELLGEDGEVIVRTNRETVDEPGRQKLSMTDIEALKKEGAGAGRDLIAQLMLSHSALEEKTTFSLAKYTLRKTKKYMRRFTVLPLDVPTLTQWLLTEKDPSKMLELQEEMLSLLGSWANIHYSDPTSFEPGNGTTNEKNPSGRWLVVDETGGLVVSALAERMGILYAAEADAASSEPLQNGVAEKKPPQQSNARIDRPRDYHNYIPAMSSRHNTLTLLHANAQPNLALLKYFQFDSSNPSTAHPLYKHLKTLSWLQLLEPGEDLGYTEPEKFSDEDIKTWKSGKRGTYYRKWRRWDRVKGVVDETRTGGFDGLVVASVMNPATVLHHTVPLLRGGAPVAVYSPYIEPLTELADFHSTSRKTAFLSRPPDPADLPNEDFPLNPTLLLAPTVQTARLRRWQCLPGRTHPVMTSTGGAAGYMFTGTRVLPAEGGVEARGKFKRRKVAQEGDGPGEQKDNAQELTAG